MKTIIVVLALAFFLSPLHAKEPDLLLRWKAHEGAGTRVLDSSGNGHDGESTTGWVTNDGISSLFFDGKPASGVRAQIPPEKAIGKESWTFIAWLRPDVLGFPVRDRPLKLFTLGGNPGGSFVIFLTGAGSLFWDTTWRNAGGETVSAKGDTASCFQAKTWAQLAVVMDQQRGRVLIYVNGRAMDDTSLPTGWNNNFTLSNQIVLGKDTKANYTGALADVAVWRRALTKAEVQAAFRRESSTYGVKFDDTLTPEEAFGGLVESGNSAMANNKTAEARGIFQKMLAAQDLPPRWAAYAELRVAQSYRLEGNEAAAKAAYEQIQKNADYPSHLRQEATDVVQEMERVSKGLPARDPAASQVRVTPIKTFAAEIWLAPDGDDANPGTAERPVATLQRARDLVRARKALADGPIAVTFKSGEYSLKEGLTLTKEDSGTADAPVVWRAEKPGAAVIYGGSRLKNFSTVTDPEVLAKLPTEARGKVVQYDLPSQGITDYGALAVRGEAQPPPPPTVELYVNQKSMTLARWPNEGFVKVTKLVQPGDKKAGIPSVIGYEDDRPARWTHAPDAWLFGYFHFLWADATAKIGKIDPAAKTITTAEAYSWNGRPMNNTQGIIYYAFNLLEEIDRPGEWYLDRDTGILYLFPPVDLGTPTKETSLFARLVDFFRGQSRVESSAAVELSVLAKPMIAASGVSHVRFEGLVFDLARGDGIELKNALDCLIAGCTVKRIAGQGIVILGGERNTLLSCDIHTIGRAATVVTGGDRETLTPGGHTVANCRMHDFGRINRTYSPGVQLEGVGNRVAHNLFYNSPSTVLRFDGNDHLIEYNEVRHAILESDDQGAMESSFNPTYRGVVLRFNSFSELGSGKERKLHAGQAGIRLDDVISGVLIYGNIFYRAGNGDFGGVQINSGRDNVIDNNVFVESARGFSGGYRARNHWWEFFRARRSPVSAKFITADSALYQQSYPEITRLLVASPGIETLIPDDRQAVNHLSRSIFYRIERAITGNRALLDELANGIFTEDPGFVDAARGNLRLKADAPAIKALGFRPIPIDEIGLYTDVWRPVIDR